MSDIPPDEVLPCGCVLRYSIVEEVRTLTYIPCHLDCRNYLNTLELASEENIPVDYKPIEG
jgi:hypothetical protein